MLCSARYAMGNPVKFDFGQEVRYEQSEGADSSAASLACVVGVTPIETAEQAKVFGYPRGTVLYTIEFGDGTDKLVPEGDLKEV
jgi:hypothetical protein